MEYIITMKIFFEDIGQRSLLVMFFHNSDHNKFYLPLKVANSLMVVSELVPDLNQLLVLLLAVSQENWFESGTSCLCHGLGSRV